MEFLTAQIFGLFGAIFAMTANQMKDKKKCLFFYIISYSFFVINLILLGAYSGAINTFIALILTIISSRLNDKKFPMWLLLLFILLILIGNIITYSNVFSLLPAVASYIYLIILLLSNMKTIRRWTVLLRVLWIIYDYIVRAYTTFVIDIVSFISSLIAIYRLDIKKKSTEK